MQVYGTGHAPVKSKELLRSKNFLEKEIPDKKL